MTDITLTEETRDGFLVAHVERTHGYFAVTADLYASKKAFELGNDNAVIAAGQLTDELEEHFPQLKPILALHLADVATGEPMHAVSNGWYHLGGGNALHELKYRAKGRRNCYRLETPAPRTTWGASDVSRFVSFFHEMAARSLRCELELIPEEFRMFGEQIMRLGIVAYTSGRDIEEVIVDTRTAINYAQEGFEAWVDGFLRKRWQDAADRANAWVDEHENTVATPSEQPSEEFTVDLCSLHAEARLSANRVKVDDVGGHFEFDVTVTNGAHTYTAQSWGSAADYAAGKPDARQAVFGVLSEMRSVIDSGGSAFEWYAGISEEEPSDEMRENLRRLDEAVDAFEDELEAHRHIIN